jgi:hypothetical protein
LKKIKFSSVFLERDPNPPPQNKEKKKRKEKEKRKRFYCVKFLLALTAT